MNKPQNGILQPLPPLARYLAFSLKPGADPRPALRRLQERVDGERTVAGLGLSLVRQVGGSVEGLRAFPVVGGRLDIPSTPYALWLWLRGSDAGELFHRSRALTEAVEEAFERAQCVDAFQYQDGRDLTGYVDGTENPEGEEAVACAIVAERPGGLTASSFVAVQLWRHEFGRFESLSGDARDDAIGRRKSDNEEIEEAPASAHVKRTAQESFAPPAFLLRRSMPWADDEGHAGLMFVAFAASFAPFEAQLRRMAGVEDGIEDALFQFTRPLTGAYFWCPGVTAGRLDLTALGL